MLAPLIVSAALVVGSLCILRLKAQGARVRFAASLWILAGLGGSLVLASFTLDFLFVLQEMESPPFRWGLFAAGVASGVAALALGIARLTRDETRSGFMTLVFSSNGDAPRR